MVKMEKLGAQRVGAEEVEVERSPMDTGEAARAQSVELAANGARADGMGYSPVVEGSVPGNWGTPLAEHRGVVAYSNGGDPEFAPRWAYREHGYEFQCVELANRFADRVLGVGNLKGSGHAKDYTGKQIGGLEWVANGTAAAPPADGDIIVFTGGSYGHIGVIRSGSETSVEMLHQNWGSSGLATLGVTQTARGFQVDGLSGYAVSGWHTRPGGVHTDLGWNRQAFVGHFAELLNLSGDPAQSWAQAQDKGIITQGRPRDTINRAEGAQILARGLGLLDTVSAEQAVDPSFAAPYADVAANTWFAPAVGALRAFGLMMGDAQNQFGPGAEFGKSDADVVAERARGGVRRITVTAQTAHVVEPPTPTADAISEPASSEEAAALAELEEIRRRYFDLIQWQYSSWTQTQADERQRIEDQDLIGHAIEFFGRNEPPDPARWDAALELLELANLQLAAGQIPEGMQTSRDAYDLSVRLREHTNVYLDTFIDHVGGTAKAVTLVRDVSIGAAATLTAIAVAPVVAPAALGLAGKIGAGALIGGATTAGLHAGGTALGQLIVFGEIDWETLKTESWSAFKQGLITGGFAVLGGSEGFKALFKLDASGLAKQSAHWLLRAVQQGAKTGAAQATLAVLETMSTAALEFATDAGFRERWAADPEAAFEEFREALLIAGATGLATGTVGGVVDSATTSNFTSSGQKGQAGKQVLAHGTGALVMKRFTISQAIKRGLREIPENVVGSIVETVLAVHADGRPMTDEDWADALLKAGVYSAADLGTAKMETAINEIANALYRHQ